MKSDTIDRLVEKIATMVKDEFSVMEVCGTHTMSIGRHGIRTLLPKELRLVSGPGCPVCVTPQEDIDRAVRIAESHEVTVATFGDMFRLPGSEASLEQAKGSGADIRIVYSPMEALDLAGKRHSRPVLFLGVGFETTTPTVAATIIEAEKRGIENFFILPMAKTVPQALRTILAAGKARIDGFLMPGHVCTVIGTKPIRFVAEEFIKPCVVTGFEALDILQGILMLLVQAEKGVSDVEIQYRRVASHEGNKKAQELVDLVFRPCDSSWRAIGVIPGSGLELKDRFIRFNGLNRFPVEIPPPFENKACKCGEILMGLAEPMDCPLFNNSCTPLTPVGPCMVSSEGTCAAHYKYGTTR